MFKQCSTFRKRDSRASKVGFSGDLFLEPVAERAAERRRGAIQRTHKDTGETAFDMREELWERA